ncbi:MAG: NUDIX hydrolase [Deltaproteobacteria bacterium]|nr:NUDIX hydrolase [Deltaproteobacteria bacterium]MBW2395198.1 NUDIX hydrolase [Deltaproteobacteria bacterium]
MPAAGGVPPLSRVVYQGRSFTMQVEEAHLPNGRTVELDVLRHPGAAAVVPFETDDIVLLIRQYRHCAGGMIWEVPAGKLDGDTPEVCAAKELEEEAGRRPGRLEKLGSVWTTPGFTDEVIHLFAAFDLEKVPARPEDDEIIEVVPTPLERALEMIWSGELRDGKSALALIHAARRLGRLT